jgi:hypothetical protein
MTEAGRRRLIAAATAVLGVIAFAVSMSFARLPAAQAAGCLQPHPDAMVRFELARSAAAVPWFYDGCRAAAIKAMDAENHLDVGAFIWSYNGFIALAAVFLARRLRRGLVIAAILAAAAALVADYVETFTLLTITKRLDDAAGLFGVSSTAAWTKFLAIGLNAGLLSAIAWTARPRRPILGALLVLPVVGTLALAANQANSAWLTYAYILSWTPLMLVAAREALWPPKASA